MFQETNSFISSNILYQGGNIVLLFSYTLQNTLNIFRDHVHKYSGVRTGRLLIGTEPTDFMDEYKYLSRVIHIKYYLR